MKPVKNNDSSALHKIVLRTNRYVTVTSSCTGAGVNTDIRLLTCFTVRKKRRPQHWHVYSGIYRRQSLFDIYRRQSLFNINIGMQRWCQLETMSREKSTRYGLVQKIKLPSRTNLQTKKLTWNPASRTF